MRKTLSESLRSALLIANRHSCCVCRKGGVQIHHINSDNSDNSWENLAILCLEHHDKATSPKGLSATLKPNQIKAYKEKWEKYCSDFTHKIARSRTAFFMVDYKNAERIRQLYSQLTNNELLTAYEILKEELIEEDKLRKVQHFDISLEPTISWSQNVQRLIEEIKTGNPHPEIFNRSPGHPKDSFYPEGPAFFNPFKPLYDIWCQIMIRCLILSRNTYDIENLMSSESIETSALSGSLITFQGILRGDIDIPDHNNSRAVCYTLLRVKNENVIWLSKLGIKTHYIYSSTASESLSRGRVIGVLFFRNFISKKDTGTYKKIRFNCTPLIIGCGHGSETLKIS